MSDKNAKRERDPMNAEGDFYVEKDSCVTCLAPHVVAPELMGFDEERGHCYFKRQPQTPEEIEHAIDAVTIQEFSNLRYAGSDPYILKKLEELGSTECCDYFARKCVKKK